MLSVRWSCVSLVVIVLFLSSSAQVIDKLTATGQKVEKEMIGGDAHAFVMPLKEAQFISVTTLQKGIDVVVVLKAPDGKELLRIDSPNGINGPEPVWYVTETAGEFQIVVSSLEATAKPGKYEIQVNSILTADNDLRRHATASNIALDAINLMASGGQDSAAAASKLEQAAKLYEQIENNVDAKSAGFLRLGRAYATNGQPESAIRFMDKAVEVFQRAGRKGDAMRALMGTPGLASSETERLRRNSRINAIAVEIGDKRVEIGSLMNMAGDHYSLGNFSEALRVNYLALKLATETNDARIPGIQDNMGTFYTARNDYASALEWHSKALVASEAKNARASVASTRLNIGNVYQSLGQYELALDSFESALKDFEATRSPVGVAYATSNIGAVYLARGELDKAVEYFEKAQALKAKLGSVDPESLFNLAATYQSKENHTKALELAEQAIEATRRSADNFLLARSYLVKAEALLHGGKHHEAQKALAEFRSVSEAYGFPQLAWSADLAQARAHILSGDRKSAIASLTRSVNVIEELEREATFSDETLLSFLSNKREPFEMLIGMLVSDQKFTDAFTLAEKTKARALVRSVASGRVEPRRTVSQEDLAAERSLTAEISSLQQRLKGAKDPVALSDTKTRLSQKRLELEDFRLRLFGRYPQLRLMRGQLEPMSLSEAAAIRGTVVEYVVTTDETFAFVVTTDSRGKPGVEVVRIDSTASQLAGSVERYHSKLASGELAFSDGSRELYDMLIKPIERKLAGEKNVVFVPDGPLWDLPFQSLMDAKGTFLIEKTAISYAPSMTALREMTKKVKARARAPVAELIAFGNPMVGDATKQRVQRVFMSEKIEPLPEAERLVNELGRMYGPTRSKIFTGSAALEETAKKESPNYRIVQFATHGVLNNVSPMYSHLVFAQNNKNPNEDGLLEAWELKDLDLKADIVILSACETARGKIANGEGVIGMTWASFIAGAPTTVASQWKVESSSTTELMLEFHRHLLTGKVSKAEALRRATLKLMRSSKYKHPSYWGGWVLVGDGN